MDEQALRKAKDNVKQLQKHDPSVAIPNWVVVGWVMRIFLQETSVTELF